MLTFIKALHTVIWLRSDNFDIYLPLFIARHNKTIYTVVLVVGAMAILLANFA